MASNLQCFFDNTPADKIMTIPPGNYSVTEPLLWTNKVVYADCWGVIINYTGPAGTVVTMGDPGLLYNSLDAGGIAGLTINNALNNPGVTGFNLVNISHANIQQLEVNNCAVGLAVTTNNSAGISYMNTITFKQMYNNDIGLLVSGVGSSTTDFMGGDWYTTGNNTTFIKVRNNGGSNIYEKMSMRASGNNCVWFDGNSPIGNLFFEGKYFDATAGNWPKIILGTGSEYCRFESYNWNGCTIVNSGTNNIFMSNTGNITGVS